MYPYLLRHRTITQPNDVWAMDITYIPVAHGFVCLAAVMDWASRRVLSWRVSITLDNRFCIDAVEEAITKYGCPTIFKTDQGSQYRALAFGHRCEVLGVRPSMGSRGDANDNAMAERCFSTLEAELLAMHRFASPGEAQLKVFRSIEGWYNPHRRHSALGQRSPLRFEQSYLSVTPAAA